MKHQIILLGKDITSVYHGIKEFQPDYIHLIYTEATSGVTDPMFPLLPSTIHTCAYLTDPYDGNKVKEVCRTIHQEYEGEFTYHLSEGTKPMAMAALEIAKEHGCRAFYLTQLGERVWLDTFEIVPMQTILDNQEIIKLSGNVLSTFHDIKNLQDDDIATSKQIKRFIENYPQDHSRIMKFFGVICHRQISRLPASQLLANELRFKIKNGGLLFTQRNQILLRTSNPNALYLYFKASWWETLVAQQVRVWTERKNNPPEAWQNVLFQTDSDNTQSKNEVDVLVNGKQKLIFIECKSGQVTQNDIYKIDGVRETYGGDISRAVLASYYPVEHYLAEKCRDLQIYVFAPDYFEDRINHLYELPNWMDALTKELQL